MCFEIFLIVIQIILDLLLIASPVLAESEKAELAIENRNIRALPCYEEDRIIGAKVFSVKPGSEFAKLEIKKGDIIKAINGKPFDSLKNIGHESSKITSIMIERSANQEGVCNLKPSIPAVLSENISLPKSEVDQSLTDMPHLLTQFRVVPYFRDGNCIGLRFFALK